MFKKVLIANRGEIAVRIIRACKELGLNTVAVYSESDKNSPHVKMADNAVKVGPPPATLSYLNIDAIISAAKETNADAVHPGYGFLAENSTFIKRVKEENLIFIGPPADVVEKMGGKVLSRKIAMGAGVPVIPGSNSFSDYKNIKKEAEKVGYPILLKSVKGGGGIGAQAVDNKLKLEGAVERTMKVSERFFGSNLIYLEKYIKKAHHVEVQIAADKMGNIAHLFERECSVQRRYQKIIEEAPSSYILPVTREKIINAAISIARAVNYESVGTIEFLVDKEQNFYFLEMNTRIQVEHPVTEMTCGIDLVREQTSIAMGRPLSFLNENVKPFGHAIECRIYAEDPKKGFLPNKGKITKYECPSGPGVRVDSGIEEGMNISIYYDPLLLKITAWDRNRTSAIARMVRALDELKIEGLKTNISFAKALLKTEDFLNSNVHVQYVEENLQNIL